MRFNIIFSALCCLCLAMPVTAVEAGINSGKALQYEPVLQQYQKFDHGQKSGDAKQVELADPHAGHDMHQGHDVEYEHHQHAEHHDHQHMQHGE